MFNLIHDGEPGRCECGVSLSLEGDGENCEECAALQRFIDRCEARFEAEGTDFIILTAEDFE